MTKQPIYLVSNNTDKSLSSLALILQSLGMKIKVTSSNQLQQHDDGMVLLDCRNLATDQYGIPEIAVDIKQKHTVVLINLVAESVNEYIALQAGIKGAFYRDIETDQLLKGLRCVLNGEFWFSRQVLSQMLNQLIEQQQPDEAAQQNATEQVNALTKRERTIIKLVCQGSKNQEIASHLNISPHTVKTHLYSTFRKTQSRNRIELLNWAKQHSLSHQLLV